MVGTKSPRQMNLSAHDQGLVDRALQDITRCVSAGQSIVQAYEELAAGIKRLVDYDCLEINIIDRDEGFFRVAYYQGVGPLGRRIGDVVQLGGSDIRAKLMKGLTVMRSSAYEDDYLSSPGGHENSRSYSGIMIPFFSRGGVLGFLSLRSRRRDAYGPYQQKILETLTFHIAPAIETSELCEKLQANVEELAVVDEVARIMTSTLNIDEVFEKFASEMKKLVDFDRVSIGVVETETQSLLLRYLFGKPRTSQPLGKSIPLMGTQTQRVLDSGEVEVWSDLADAPDITGNREFQKMGLRSSIAVPLISNDRGIASLVLRSCKRNAYGAKERVMLERLARQITPAIVNAQMYEQTRQAQECQRKLAQENTLLAEIGRIISSTLDVSQVYEQFAEKVREVIPFDSILVSAVDREANALTRSYAAGVGLPKSGRDQTPTLEGSFSAELIDTKAPLQIQGAKALEEASQRLPYMRQIIEGGFQSFLGAPLVYDDQAIGTITVRSLEANHYTEEHLALLERMGLQIAPAIVNSELYQQRRKAEESLLLRNEELSALVNIASILSLPAEFEEKATHVLAELMEIAQADSAVLRVPDEQEQTLRLVASAGVSDKEFPVENIVPYRGTIPGMALEQGQVVTVNDYARHPQATKGGLKRGNESITSLPIQAGGATLGVVNVLSKSPGHFTPERVTLLAAIADGLGMLMENARLSQDLLGRDKEMAVVDEVARIITTTLEIDEVYDKFADEVRKLMDFDRINITSIDRRVGVYRLRNMLGSRIPGKEVGDAFPLEGSKSGYVMNSGQTLVQPDLSQERRFQSDIELHRMGFLSAIAVPLICKYQVIGILSLRSRRLAAFGSREQAVLERLAKQIAPAVENARLYEKSRSEEVKTCTALAQLKALLGGVDAGVLLVNDDRQVLWMNQKMGDFFGFDVDSFTKRHTSAQERRKLLESRLVDPVRVFAEIDRIYADQGYAGDYGAVEVLYPQYRILQPFTTPVYDEKGGYIGRLWVYHDVTENRKAEEELRKLSYAVEQSPNSVIITNTEGGIEYVNPKFEAVTGYSLEEIVGKKLDLLNSGETSTEDYMRMWETINDGREWRGQLHNRKKNGDLYWSEFSASGIRDCAGTLTHFVALEQDVTERKRLEEQFLQSQKMESVGRLAGGVAHDFNNLLTAIMGYAQLALIGANPSNSQFSQIKEIQNATERAANLTNQLLAFSRNQVIEPRAVDLNQLIINLDRMLRRLIGENIELVSLLAANLDPVKVDPGQIDQVLMNLVINARDAMSEGGRLSIETQNLEVSEKFSQEHPTLVPGRHVLLSVRDTGIGMSKEIMGQIFEPFFTTKEMGKGTGLGLSTCYGVVQQSGGHIEVQSEMGKGATFLVYLPVTDDEPGLPRTTQQQQDLPQGKETVLIAEDEPLVRSIVATVLRDQGYEVLETVDGEEALEIAQKHAGQTIHLLMTDVVMPTMSGPDLAERLKAMHPEIKTLYTSGYTEDSLDQVPNLKPGVAFLSKPYKPEILAIKVREVLDA